LGEGDIWEKKKKKVPSLSVLLREREKVKLECSPEVET